MSIGVSLQGFMAGNPPPPAQYLAFNSTLEECYTLKPLVAERTFIGFSGCQSKRAATPPRADPAVLLAETPAALRVVPRLQVAQPSTRYAVSHIPEPCPRANPRLLFQRYLTAQSVSQPPRPRPLLPSGIAISR